MKAKIVIFNGCDEMDALVPFEVFQHAAKPGADPQVESATIERSDEITSAHGVRFRPHAVLFTADKSDVLVVPGGGRNNPNAKTQHTY